MSRRARIFAGIILIPLALFLVASGVLIMTLRSPLPENGRPGAEADAAARELEARVGRAAWNRVGAVEWTFRKGREHLWDCRRQFYRYRTKDGEVLFDLVSRQGRATEKGRELAGEELDRALQAAYSAWTNDGFWLNPFNGLFDEGVSREIVPVPEGDPGTTALLIRYGTGGVTPGDAFLWLVPEQGPPVAWRMWTSIFPIQGIRVTWDGWKQLLGGPWISTVHAMPGIEFGPKDVRAAQSLAELTGGADPFEPLLALQGPPPSSQPAETSTTTTH